jgi:nitroreductase
MKSIIETIKMRRSCRTYDSRAIDVERRTLFEQFLTANTAGPFGSAIRFILSDFSQVNKGEMKIPGTYGVIQGAPHFIIGAVKKNHMAMEDYGYAMEKNILYATELGLETCWLGGTFQRSGFARYLDLKEEELLPAISPLGYGKEKKSLTDRVFRYIASSDKRKPWEQLFFLDNLETPLERAAAGGFSEVLESLRAGPSASNRQPWRIVKDKDSERFHFFIRRTPGYGRLIGEISLQNIDMGIAMCHFELSARELGLQGQWVKSPPPGLERVGAGMEYIVTWRGRQE